jgi:hypothetical protein
MRIFDEYGVYPRLPPESVDKFSLLLSGIYTVAVIPVTPGHFDDFCSFAESPYGVSLRT